MPRTARTRGPFCTYHVVERGNNRNRIFLNDSDRWRMLETLAKAKAKYNFLIYAYCLMDNHIHLLVGDNGNDISKLMQSINVSYALYFNRVHNRAGHLFQDRFRSELVEDDRYLLEVSRYIHNNPVRAGIVQKPEQYRWSSYAIYLGKAKDELELVDTSLILGHISSLRKTAVAEYQKYVTRGQESCESILDIEEEHEWVRRKHGEYIESLTDAKKRLALFLAERGLTLEELLKEKKERDDLIRTFRKNSSLNLKELGELFGGLSQSQVSRILRN